MDISPHISEQDVPHAKPLPRTRGTFDISKLSQSSTSNERPVSSSEASTVNSQVLYMKIDSKPRRSALRSAENAPEPLFKSRVADCKSRSEGGGPGWIMMDQEIREWQYHCQTGQPFCFSPKSYQPLQIRPPSRHGIEVQEHGQISEKHGSSDVKFQKRTLADQPEENSMTHHELARIAAIRLLGSCYTLSPHDAPDAATSAAVDGMNVPISDPRLISSLRMHSQFRYSPCFGHQARNVSPIPNWSSTFDGTSSIVLPGQNVSLNDVGQDEDQGVVSDLKRPRKFMPKLHRRISSDINKSQHKSFAISVNRRSSQASELHAHELRPGTGELTDLTEILLQTGRSLKNSTSVDSTSTNLQLKTRSLSSTLCESNVALAQPSRDTVIRRLTTLAKRVGKLRTRRESLLGSDDAPSSLPSPALSASGKERRKRAQQDSEIDGGKNASSHVGATSDYQVSSVNSNSEKYCSSDSEDATPYEKLAQAFNSFTDSNGPALEEDKFLREGPKVPLLIQDSSLLPQRLSTESECQVSRKRGIASPPLPRKPSPPRSLSQRRSKSRTRRRSLLSEVYTHELQDEKTNTDAGESPMVTTTPPMSIEEVRTPSPTRVPSEWLDRKSLCMVDIAPSFATKMFDRPDAIRMSTAGTQMFKPS